MNGIHEVTGSIPVWSTNSKSLILKGRNYSATLLVEPRRRARCELTVFGRDLVVFAPPIDSSST
jgi:hypothetical protein